MGTGPVCYMCIFSYISTCNVLVCLTVNENYHTCKQTLLHSGFMYFSIFLLHDKLAWVINNYVGYKLIVFC